MLQLYNVEDMSIPMLVEDQVRGYIKQLMVEIHGKIFKKVEKGEKHESPQPTLEGAKVKTDGNTSIFRKKTKVLKSSTRHRT